MSRVVIALEGIDGAGTTSQAKILADALSSRATPVHSTCQPSDGKVGRLLREYLHNGDEQAPQLLGLLFAADRMDQWQSEVSPALDEGKVVISDRWYHSSLAYQGVGELRSWVEELNKFVPAPTVTIFLQVTPGEALRRRQAANRPEELFDALDVQTKIAERYEQVMAACSQTETVEILDGQRPVDVIAVDILAIADKYL